MSTHIIGSGLSSVILVELFAEGWQILIRENIEPPQTWPAWACISEKNGKARGAISPGLLGHSYKPQRP